MLAGSSLQASMDVPTRGPGVGRFHRLWRPGHVRPRPPVGLCGPPKQGSGHRGGHWHWQFKVAWPQVDDSDHKKKPQWSENEREGGEAGAGGLAAPALNSFCSLSSSSRCSTSAVLVEFRSAASEVVFQQRLKPPTSVLRVTLLEVGEGSVFFHDLFSRRHRVRFGHRALANFLRAVAVRSV